MNDLLKVHVLTQNFELNLPASEINKWAIVKYNYAEFPEDLFGTKIFDFCLWKSCEITHIDSENRVNSVRRRALEKYSRNAWKRRDCCHLTRWPNKRFHTFKSGPWVFLSLKKVLQGTEQAKGMGIESILQTYSVYYFSESTDHIACHVWLKWGKLYRWKFWNMESGFGAIW